MHANRHGGKSMRPGETGVCGNRILRYISQQNTSRAAFQKGGFCATMRGIRKKHMNTPSPAYDNKITRKYSMRTIEHKIENKLALQESLGWPQEKRMPMLCIPTGMSDALGGEVLRALVPGMLTQEMSLLVLGKGTQEYGTLFTDLAKRKSYKIAIIKNDDESIRSMYAAADMALFLVDPAPLPELECALRYGTVPIAPATKALQNYNPVQESGNAFLFRGATEWHAFAAIVRALETYSFPFDWRTIQRHCMQETQE